MKTVVFLTVGCLLVGCGTSGQIAGSIPDASDDAFSPEASSPEAGDDVSSSDDGPTCVREQHLCVSSSPTTSNCCDGLTCQEVNGASVCVVVSDAGCAAPCKIVADTCVCPMDGGMCLKQNDTCAPGGMQTCCSNLSCVQTDAGHFTCEVQ